MTPSPQNLAPAKLTVPPENLAPLKSPPSQNGAGEVEIQATPGDGRGAVEMCGDDPDDGVADLAADPPGQPLLHRGITAGLRFIRTTEITVDDQDPLNGTTPNQV